MGKTKRSPPNIPPNKYKKLYENFPEAPEISNGVKTYSQGRGRFRYTIVYGR